MPSTRFAWFVMVHHKPAQFEWLINAIDDADEPILVHVDAKSRLGLKADRRGTMAGVRRVAALHPNIRLMRSRFTNWGGWSLSQVLLDAIAVAVLTDPDWQFFVNLSGQCYPLQPVAAIREQVAAAGDVVHVEMQPIATLPDTDWHRAAPGMIETPLRAFRRPPVTPPTRFAVDHKGSQWVVLPRSFCEWLVSAPLTADVRRHLRRRLLSDELLIQTLAANGPFCDRLAPDYRRTIIWPGPRVLTATDVAEDACGTNWFGRKFDLVAAPEAMRLLAERNGFRPGPMAGP